MTQILTPWTDMRTPALAIVARGDQIEPVTPSQYKVHSQSHHEKIANEQIINEIPSIIKRFKKDDLLREVEKELGLPVVARGYRENDGTFSKESMAEVLLGMWRLKRQYKINSD